MLQLKYCTDKGSSCHHSKQVAATTVVTRYIRTL